MNLTLPRANGFDSRLHSFPYPNSFDFICDTRQRDNHKHNFDRAPNFVYSFTAFSNADTAEYRNNGHRSIYNLYNRLVRKVMTRVPALFRWLRFFKFQFSGDWLACMIASHWERKASTLSREFQLTIPWKTFAARKFCWQKCLSQNASLDALA